MKNNCNLTISFLAPLIRRKKISPVEITEFILERISRLQTSINAYITITPESALEQARHAESEIAKGHYRGMLHGIPMNLKDLFYTRGVLTTAGSRVLRGFIPDSNAAIVDRLQALGCVLLGKTNMHEFAFGATNVNPHYGPVRNPWDTNCLSGGSSGGSAASVVSAQTIASFGTDTGGSIRIPSSACGCVGLKPTYNRISTKGVIPLSTSLDHVGTLSRSVMDAAILLDAVDPGFHFANRIKHLCNQGVKSLRIGVPRQYFFDFIQPDVREAVLEAVHVFRNLGAIVQEVQLKGMEDTARLAADITGAEALAFHERMLEQNASEYSEDVRSRLEQNRTMPAIRYIRCMLEKSAYAEEFAKAFESFDLVLTPTLPITAPLLDAKEISIGNSRQDVRTALLSLTRPGNLTGLPAISLPCGFSTQHLPVGLQLIGRYFEEETVLRAAYAYESETPWHAMFPEQEEGQPNNAAE